MIDINTKTLPAKKNLLQKLYGFFQSNIGIAILFLSYIFWSYPLGPKVIDNLLEAIGILLGSFLPTYMVVLVLSKMFNWSFRQRVLNTFLILYALPIIQMNQTLHSLQSNIFILFFVAGIYIIVVEIFKRIFKK